jgi:hypothetical protein
MKANAPDELSGSFLLDGPNSVTAKMPMPNHGAHVSPRLQTVPCFAAKVAHNFRIGSERGIGFKILQPNHPQPQPFGFKLNF